MACAGVLTTIPAKSSDSDMRGPTWLEPLNLRHAFYCSCWAAAALAVLTCAAGGMLQACPAHQTGTLGSDVPVDRIFLPLMPVLASVAQTHMSRRACWQAAQLKDECVVCCMQAGMR
jgi:hypothetical protein